MDLAAERVTIAAERAGEKIAVEIQSFLGDSDIDNLHHAVGQYVVYRLLLEEQHPGRILYLAVPDSVYDGILCERVGQLVRDRVGIHLLVFDPATRRVLRWIS